MGINWQTNIRGGHNFLDALKRSFKQIFGKNCNNNFCKYFRVHFLGGKYWGKVIGQRCQQISSNYTEIFINFTVSFHNF